MKNTITETSAKIHFVDGNIFNVEVTIGDTGADLSISVTDKEGITQNHMPFCCSAYDYAEWTTRSFAKEWSHQVNWVIGNM